MATDDLGPTMRHLILVPARSGSKGLPGKNTAHLGGLSLLERSVLCARAFAARLGPSIEGRVCTDTDDPGYAKRARLAGSDVPFLREPAFAADGTTTADSVARFVERLAELDGWVPTSICILQPTSPLRSASDVLECWERWHHLGAPSLVAVESSNRTPPMAYRDNGAGRLQHYGEAAAPNLRRQGVAPALYASGAVYFISFEAFMRTHRFVASGETAFFTLGALPSIDVDDANDLQLAETLLAGLAARGSVQQISRSGQADIRPIMTLHDLLEAVAGGDWGELLRVDSRVLISQGLCVASLARLRPVRVEIWCESRPSLKAVLPLAGGAERLVIDFQITASEINEMRTAIGNSSRPGHLNTGLIE